MDDFLSELSEILEEDSLAVNAELKSFKAWDSLAVLSVIALADGKYGKKLNAKQINACVSVQDLHNLVSNSGA